LTRVQLLMVAINAVQELEICEMVRFPSGVESPYWESTGDNLEGEDAPAKDCGCGLGVACTDHEVVAVTSGLRCKACNWHGDKLVEHGQFGGPNWWGCPDCGSEDGINPHVGAIQNKNFPKEGNDGHR